ncbi:RibD C-terminal domain containing protein [Novymonas esmeraldas]|uniref:RibD C-terminal domain containing protein n=1 Tax=Novymonas esmeraldas TaxID=1808958 RepID=A0AAW0EY60_9TRYP
MSAPVVVTVEMLVSLDGKTSGEMLETPRCVTYLSEYSRIKHEVLKPRTPVCMCGSNSIAWMIQCESPDNYPTPDREPGERADFHADLDTFQLPTGNHYFAVVDPRGRLAWKQSTVYSESFPFYNGDRVVEVLVEDWVTDAFLAQLRRVNVPYIFAGKSALDCRLAVDKLGALFHTDRVECHGGGTLNGSLLEQGVVDELSLVLAPVVSGDPAAVSLFSPFRTTTGGKLPMADFDLSAVEKLADGALWLRYTRKA